MSKRFYSKQFSAHFECKNSELFKLRFSSIWPIDMTLSGATTLSQSGPENNANEGVLCIPQSYIISGTSPFDSLVSYSGNSLVGGCYSSTEKQSVYSTAPVNWATNNRELRDIYIYISFAEVRIPWFSLSIRPYHPSLLAGLLGYTLLLHRANDRLVRQHWHVYEQKSIRDSCWWVCPWCFCLYNS